MSDQQTAIKQAQIALEQHRSNLRKLRAQQATYEIGGERLSLLNQIEHEQDEIRSAKATLRQLGKEPEQAIGDPPETLVPFARRLLVEYPEPIAQACAQFNQAHNEREQFIALDRLLVHLTKYLAAIFIGQARLDHLTEYPLPQSLEWMAYPELEDWTRTIRRLGELYQQPDQRSNWRIPDLLTACTRRLLDRAELLDVIDYLTLALNRKGLDEPSVIDLLQLFASHRDKEWQDDPGSYDQAPMNALLLRLQPALALLLNELATLRDYPLLYVEWADTKEPTIHIRAVKFMGQKTEELTPSHKPPLTIAVAGAPPIKPGRLYVGNSAGQPLLPLHPFLVIHRWESYILDRHPPTQFIEFRACNGVKRFRPPTEAKSFHSLWVQGEQSPAPATDVPPILGEENAIPTSVEPLHSQSGGEPLPLTWFNAEGREALAMALGEALRIGRVWLGVEFLLMALSKQTDNIFPTLLHEIGLEPGGLRGALRSMAGVVVQSDNWKQQDVAVLGAAALSQLRLMDTNRLQQGFVASPDQSPVYTPRVEQVLQVAQSLAGESQIGHAHLLWAIFQQSQALSLQLFFGLAHEQGWSPKQVLARLATLVGAKPDAAEAAGAVAGGLDFSPPPHNGPPPALQPASVLARYGRDLTAEAQSGKLHPVLGESARQALLQIGRILLQREANNPLLIGDPGVGKSAIVEGFAWRLAGGGKGAVEPLAGRRLLELSPNILSAGTKYRGDLENRVQQLLAAVKAADGQIILFIDEIHALLSSSNSGVADALKPALARGEFPCIGATTVAEYRQHIEKDGALARRFTPVWIAEPTLPEALEIVSQTANEHLAHHHQVRFEPAAIEAAVRLADRYILDERLPGKVIKLLDQAAAGRVIGGSLSGLGEESSALAPATVTVDAILEVVSSRTNIPVSQLGKSDKQRLLELEGKLKAHILGQDEAVGQVVRLVRRAGAGLTDPRRPQAVFLLAGPTGVGKTELALALASVLFDRQEAICRLDMSEFMEKHQVARLIGAPPGYVGYSEEGQLTGRLRRQPYSVVLLDEIEKAHPDVQHLFLQLFDSGRLTDSQGRIADGRRAIFIMTTNLGAREAIGFADMRKSYEEKLLAAIQAHFSPEFVNRIDRILYFNPLNEAALLAIFDRELGLLQRRLAQEHQIALKLPEAAKLHLVRQALQEKMGARPLRRLIEDHILTPVVDKLLAGEVTPGSEVTIHLRPEPANTFSSEVPR